jgi:hypothetical protein
MLLLYYACWLWLVKWCVVAYEWDSFAKFGKGGGAISRKKKYCRQREAWVSPHILNNSNRNNGDKLSPTLAFKPCNF